jgi:mannose-1-phosphate guanylyltransferase
MGKLFFGKLNKKATVVPVVMAGGSGTRFWPQSRRAHPKQFLSLTEGGESLIQQTVSRLGTIADPSAVMVVTAKHQRALVQEHLPNSSVLAEPLACNTAPCVGYAALKVLHEVGDVPMLCLPADHIIENIDAFIGTLKKAVTIANENDALVTIGIKPTHPETGYGYIKTGESLAGDGYAVEQFVEKPDLETAKKYQEAGTYFWNSGMFVWRPSVILDEINSHLPELHAHLSQLTECFGQEDEEEKITEIFQQITPISIDFGVMEKANQVIMVPGSEFIWNDIGSWSAWADCLAENEQDKDESGNITQGDVVMVGSKDCTVIGKTAGNKRLIAGVGLENVIIVETDDSLLVCHKDSAQQVKDVVDVLKKANREELL